MDKDQQIINQIKKIRSKNNTLWMQILQIAWKHAPDECRDVFKKIVHNDSEITKLSKELCE